MKQTINLLPIKPKEVRSWLSFNSLLVILAITLVSTVSLSAYFWWQASSLQKTLKEQNLANKSANYSIVDLTIRLAQKDAPAELTTKALQLTQQVAAMQQMLDLSEELELTQQDGFLSLLKRLQSSVPQASQLESFKAAAGDKFEYIRGITSQPDTLPQLLDNLRNQGLLQDQNISKLRIQRDVEHHSFEILTAPKEAIQ